MSWSGGPGAKGHIMTTKEALTSMARLSLMGKLKCAIFETDTSCPGWRFLVPYYNWNPSITAEEVLLQISLQSFASQYETLPERVLSILLRKLQGKDLD